MAEDLFDYAQLLDLNKAHVVAQNTTGLNSDEVYELRFKCANAAYPAAKRWLVANRRILNNFEAEFKSYPDLYRTVSITWKENKSDARDGGYIIHTIAKGLITSLVSDDNVDWSEARKVSGRSLEGNEESAPDSIENTTSDDQERHITVRWPYCDPLTAQAVLDSLNASTYSDVEVDGETVAGTWHRIVTSYEKAEDGTCAITMQLAEPQYTLNAFRSLETLNGSDVVYLWQVPKALAQGIMDAWKVATPTEGRAATASYDSSGGLVNIVLTRVAGSPPNLTRAMKTACDEVTSYHFAWRYTEAEMETFLDNHNGALGANMRRDVRVQTRGDGFFDVVITERVITFDEDEHIVDVATTSGLTIITKHFGWNVPMNELLARRVEFQVVAEGVSSTFSVKRQDDCSFDYEGTVQVRNLVTKTVDLGGTGIQVRVLSGEAMTQSELTLAAAGFASAVRKRTEARVSVGADGLASAAFTETEVQKTEAAADSGANGIQVEVMSGKNVDVGDLGAIYASAARENVSIQLSGNDDGTFNYSATRQTVVRSVGDADSGEDGIAVETMSGKNVDLSDLNAIYDSAARQQVSISLSSNDDGTFNYSATKQTVQESEATADSGANGIAVETMSGKNVDASALAAIYDSAAREQVSISLSSNDDGTFNYSATRQTVQASEATADSGADGIAVETMSGKNVDADALGSIYESAARAQVSISLSSNDDGTFNYSATRQTVQESEATADSGGDGIAVETMSGKNVDAAALGSIYDSAARAQVSISLSSNDDGTFNYSATRQTVKAASGTAEIETDGTDGLGYVVKVGHNVEEDIKDIVTGLKSGVGVQHSIRISPNDDGTLGYVVTEVTEQSPQYAKEVVLGGDLGLGVKVSSGVNVTSSEIDTIISGLTSEARTTHDVIVHPQTDGGFSYRVVERTTQKSEETWTAGTVGETQTVRVGKHQDELTIDPVIIGDTVSMRASFDDDGTVSFTEVREQQNEQTPAGATNLAYGTKILGKELTAGLFADVVAGLSAPALGVSYEVRVEILPTGKLNYKMVKTTGNAQSESTDLASTNPPLKSRGENRTATYFRSATAIPTTSAPYYEFTRLVMNDDCTWDGVLEIITYGDPNLDDFVLATGNWDSGHRHYINYQKAGVIETHFRETHFHNDWIITRDGTAALGHIHGGDINSTCTAVRLDGILYWHAKKVLKFHEQPWSKLV